MTSPTDSKTSDLISAGPNGESTGLAKNNWLKLGIVAVASAVLGGAAAAWFYRGTLSRFREAENANPDTMHGPKADGPEEDF